VDDPSSTSTDVERSASVSVVAGNEQSEVEVEVARWADLAERTLVELEMDGELTLTFVDRDEMEELNRTYMDGAGPTDVLSFPLDAADADPPAAVAAPRLLGDVVICPSVAAEAAPTHAGTVDDELALLVVHGILHVGGFDHADSDEAAAMRAREIDLLTRHHWHGPPPTGFVHEQAAS
jgi:probable rRNA maturation factor